MNALLKLSFKNTNGNLIWAGKYIYPESDLKAGISELQRKGYWISQFPEGDGLTFKIKDGELENFNDFEVAFPWMNIKGYLEDEEFNFEADLNHEQIIILPLSRLKIDHPIYSKNLCIFPVGEFPINNLNMQIPEKLDLNNIPHGIVPVNRALVTSVTQIDKTAFAQNAVVVFRDSITIEEYAAMQQTDDIQLIKKYSNRAESALDLIRFFECNFTVPELLPAKAGIWDDRYSTALVYFPIYDLGFVQSREVEIKTFIKGIGPDIHSGFQISHLPIFLYDDELGEVGKFCKYALKLNTAIAESDNQSIKFIQIMTFLEFIGDPYGYKSFQTIKGKIIAYIAEDKSDYHRLSEKFIYYSKVLRTDIVHNGKRIEDLLSNNKILGIFEFFHKTIYTIIWDLMMHYDMSWADYQDERKIIQDELTQ